MRAEHGNEARDELWRSMVSQLRSKLGAKEASGELEATHLNEPLSNEFIMTAKGSFLSVWLDAESGEGSWNAISQRLDRAEPWFMSIDGEVELSGEIMDIPTAVERFIEKIYT